MGHFKLVYKSMWQHMQDQHGRCAVHKISKEDESCTMGKKSRTETLMQQE